MAGTPEKDSVSGQSTTGHEWDGIKELNTPLPKWWVWVFYITIVWSVGYWVVYPSIPGAQGFFAGTIGYSSRAEVENDIAAARAAHRAEIEAVAATELDGILADPVLRQYAMAGGAVLFKENCAGCHQSGGAGAFGYPTLADDEWIWGGDVESIAYTIRHGVRWEKDPETRLSEMPAFGEFMTQEEIGQVSDYVVAMAEGQPASGPGEELYVSNCASCHSSDGMSPVSDGNAMVGAPALANKVWLYSRPGLPVSSHEVATQISAPRHGVMPSWSGRLSEADIKQLTVYVHSLGGGQ